ncbi:BnaA03g60390D [Brassica napus]|uniref:BnaA03g60390D protein n=1 Tax=Brassica napus TaxID=3708 RepID=A0A078H061_BRANA|nr:BnaA03g60390D [Brassica napus]
MGFRSYWTEKRDDIRPLSSMYLQQDKAKLLVPSSCEVGDHRRALSVNAKGDSKSTAQTLLSFLRIPAIELCRESASSRRRRMSSATHQLVYRMHTR